MTQEPNFSEVAAIQAMEGHFIVYWAHNGILLGIGQADYLWEYPDGALKHAVDTASSVPDRDLVVAQVIDADGTINKYWQVINRFTSGEGIVVIDL